VSDIQLAGINELSLGSTEGREGYESSKQREWEVLEVQQKWQE
jgi:hypothetical protein